MTPEWLCPPPPAGGAPTGGGGGPPAGAAAAAAPRGPGGPAPSAPAGGAPAGARGAPRCLPGAPRRAAARGVAEGGVVGGGRRGEGERGCRRRGRVEVDGLGRDGGDVADVVGRDPLHGGRSERGEVEVRARCVGGRRGAARGRVAAVGRVLD